MELTPGALRETTFRTALRGYNVDDVDEFVEGVSAGVGELLEQVRLSSDRASTAERRAKATIAASEESMKRTLSQAKKLAEAMVAEARREARRVTEQARLAVEKLAASAQDEAGTEEPGEVDVDEVDDVEHKRAEAAELWAAARAEADELRAAARAEADELRAAARAEAEELRATARAEADVAAGVAANVASAPQADPVAPPLEVTTSRPAPDLGAEVERVRLVLVEALAALGRPSTPEPTTVSDVDPSLRLDDVPVMLEPALIDAPVEETPAEEISSERERWS